MKCPSCEADNPDGAEFCSLCLQRLEGPAQDAEVSAPREAAAGKKQYVAPGEWRGDSRIMKAATSKVVERKVKRFHWKLAVYGLIVVAVIMWLVLSFTVWGNPSPGEKSMQLIEAINERDEQAFCDLLSTETRDQGENMYEDIEYYLGSSGNYADICLDVTQDDNYIAQVYIESGIIDMGGSSEPVSLDRSDNLMITLENRKGTWYVNPTTTKLIP